MLSSTPPVRWPSSRIGGRARGATMVEYALIIVGVMLIASGAWRMLGTSVKKTATNSGDELADRGERGGAGGRDGRGGAAGDGRSGGGHGGGTGGGGGGGSGRAVAGAGADARGGSYASENGQRVGASADTADLTFKRSLGVSLLAAGLIAIGYVIAKARNLKNAVRDQGDTPGDGPPA